MGSNEQKGKDLQQEVVVYHLVDMDFRMRNIYGFGGPRPNAKHIASQYDCQLEFRESRFEAPHNTQFVPSYLEGRGIDPRTGRCISAVLVGQDREKLHRARDDILRTFGCGSTEGSVDVGYEKTLI